MYLLLKLYTNRINDDWFSKSNAEVLFPPDAGHLLYINNVEIVHGAVGIMITSYGIIHPQAADRMANSDDPDHTDCFFSSLIWFYTVCPNLSVRKRSINMLHVPVLGFLSKAEHLWHLKGRYLGPRDMTYTSLSDAASIKLVRFSVTRWKYNLISQANYLFYIIGQPIYEPQHDKTNKMSYAPSEDSDQPGYPPSLIRVFALCSIDN